MERLFENFEEYGVPTVCERIGVPPPKWLKGTMLRNGPGMFKAGDTEMKHWFDGLAFLQRYHFEDGNLIYSARYLQSEYYKSVKEKNRIAVTSFGTFKYPDPCQSIFARINSHFERSGGMDNCDVSFAQQGDKIYAVTEVTKMVQIHPDTLETIRTVDVADSVDILSACTAHTQADNAGNTYNVGSSYGPQGSYAFIINKPSGMTKGEGKESESTTELIGTIPQTFVFEPAYFHSFGMSQNYFVLFECPLRIDLKSLGAAPLYGWTFQSCFVWKEHTNVNVLVFDQKTKQKHNIKYTSPPFFTFHHVNTFEKDGFIIVDFVYIENPGTLEDLELQHMKTGDFRTKNKKFKPFLHRMVLPISIPPNTALETDLAKKCSLSRGARAILGKDGEVRCEHVRLCKISMEFPTYNDTNYHAKESKYVYGTTIIFQLEKEFRNVGVVKVDTTTGECQTWKKDTDKGEQHCAEPIFVPSPTAKTEDDGVLLIPVITINKKDRPFVLVLDAVTMKEICRYIIPQDRIPLGFHSHYVRKNKNKLLMDRKWKYSCACSADMLKICREFLALVNQCFNQLMEQSQQK